MTKFALIGANFIISLIDKIVVMVHVLFPNIINTEDHVVMINAKSFSHGPVFEPCKSNHNFLRNNYENVPENCDLLPCRIC